MNVYILIRETYSYCGDFEVISEVNIEGVFSKELDAKLALLNSKGTGYDAFYIEEMELIQ
ncbi:hypothetical protein P4U05_17055 [Bacillus paranthracis]|uniref:DUF7336 domain-containing protein n=1 Tax=Bacillus paranthracis TaxID=2026186 RepID=UPI000200F40F|nr:hypothetical protein [Bacillus paranthracis]YP_009206341.1 hypothetical protein XO26_0042 [Bacillus phage phi4B1]ADY20335.1 hypothetical protein YBT020_05445 [Bacillus thuringiensis serovar finitimus YBT-020]MRC72830.1 hypothetical protein [Bacillus thuringiensis]OTX71279.1 hypothetical protein BK722_12765 [Bacillus thuringiensis serovar finitimus]PGZ45724.1 hypothetical protein COE56_25930 [Bacillus anthracis]ALF02574.1 hypothetical protein XO26_0042 [Bacillus phage phi4B1]